MNRFCILFLLWVFNSITISCLSGQGATDLYLFSLHQSSNHVCHVFDAKFLSGFNPGGYTNQPWFTPKGDLLVSVRKAGESQNDIYRLSLMTHKITRMTNTAANEYSPRIHPDGQQMSVLHQVEGEPIDQQVWIASLKDGSYKSITPQIKNIGYYTWMSGDALGLFVIEGESNYMVYHQLAEEKSQRVTSSIGRTLLTDGAGELVYVHKFDDVFWYIKKYNPASAVFNIIIQTPGKSEDFALAPDGTYFMAIGSKLYSFHPSYHTAWQDVGDLSAYGLNQISRLAVSPDGSQLAVVANKE